MYIARIGSMKKKQWKSKKEHLENLYVATENKETRDQKNLKEIMDKNLPQLRIDVGVQTKRN